MTRVFGENLGVVVVDDFHPRWFWLFLMFRNRNIPVSYGNFKSPVKTQLNYLKRVGFYDNILWLGASEAKGEYFTFQSNSVMREPLAKEFGNTIKEKVRYPLTTSGVANCIEQELLMPPVILWTFDHTDVSWK